MSKKKAYVVGANASKSLSPLIFNYWFNKYKVEGEYNYIEIKEEKFDKEIKGVFNEEGLCGLNITIPFKEKIIPHLKLIDKHSKLIGAVNCVNIKNKLTEGTNTDWIGFTKSIKKTKKNNVAIVLGYGGSAKAIIYSLILTGFKEIRVFNRSFDKIKNLKNIIPHKLNELDKHYLSADIIINTIPKDLVNKLINKKLIENYNKKETGHGFDIVYNQPTLFLENFKPSRRIYGVEMLAHQAAPCFFNWFGILPEIDDNLINILMKS